MSWLSSRLFEFSWSQSTRTRSRFGFQGDQMSQARSHQRCVVCRCSVQRSELFENLLAERTGLNHYPEKICFILSRRKISKTASQDRPRWSRLFLKPSLASRWNQVRTSGWSEWVGQQIFWTNHIVIHTTPKNQRPHPQIGRMFFTGVHVKNQIEKRIEIHDGSDHMTKWPTHRFNFNSAKWHLQLISAVIFTGIQFCNMFFFHSI